MAAEAPILTTTADIHGEIIRDRNFIASIQGMGANRDSFLAKAYQQAGEMEVAQEISGMSGEMKPGTHSPYSNITRVSIGRTGTDITKNLTRPS